MSTITHLTFDQEDEINHPYCGYDLHVIRNGISTMPLDVCMLGVIDGLTTFNIKDYITAANQPGGTNALELDLGYAGSGILFTPKLLFTSSGNNAIAKDVSINVVTGAITASPLDPLEPDYFKDFNFIIEISIKTAPPSPQIPKTFYTSIRVYVHESINNVWLTPTTLNVPKNTSNFRYSVYAEFDDGIVADISYHPGISWTSDTPANATINADTGRITPVPSATDYSTSEITAHIPSSLRPTSISSLASIPANVKIIPTLLDRPGFGEIKAKLVGGVQKRDDLDNYLNILFLSDGFKEADENLFNNLVAKIINCMSSDKSTSPFDILSKDSINFWTTFIPSEERGGTFLTELIQVEREFPEPHINYTPPSTYTITWNQKKPDENKLEFMENIIKEIDSLYLDKDNKVVDDGYFLCPFKGIGTINTTDKYAIPGQPMFNVPFYDSSHKPQKQSSNWILYDILEKLGLPSQLDKTRTLLDMEDKWKKLFDAYITTGTGNKKIREDMFEIWQKFADRGIPNQVNTALGYKSGLGCILDEYFLSIKTSQVNLNENRLNKTGLEAVLGNLKDELTGNVLGRWGETNKDYGFVAILSGGVNQGGANNHSLGISAFNLKTLSEEDNRFSYSSPASRQLKIDADDFFTNYISVKILQNNYCKEIARTVAHEISHSFPIEDEYGKEDNGVGQNTFDSVAYNLQSLDSLNSTNWKVKWGRDYPYNDGKIYRYRRISSTVKNNFTFIQDTEIPILFVFEGNDVDTPNINKFTVGDKWWIYSQDESEIILDIKVVNINEEFVGSKKRNKYTIKVAYEDFGFGQTLPITAPPSGNILCKLIYDKREGFGTISANIGSKDIIGADTYFYFQARVGDKIEIRYWKDAAMQIQGSVIKEIEIIYNSSSIKVTTDFEVAINGNFKDYVIIANTFSYLLNRTVGRVIGQQQKSMTVKSTDNPTTDLQRFFPLNTDLTIVETYDKPQKPKVNHLKIDNSLDFFTLLAPLAPLIDATNVVGLFAGGGRGIGFNDNIFHPTGDCLMRNVGILNPYETNPNITRTFCPVCRHIMVSFVNPLKLEDLNIDYVKYNDPKV